MSASVTPVFGGFPIGEGKSFPDLGTLEELYKLLDEGGCKTIDTARLYGNSEEWIGKSGAGNKFVIDTKALGGFEPGSTNADGVMKQVKESLERMGTKQVRQQV